MEALTLAINPDEINETPLVSIMDCLGCILGVFAFKIQCEFSSLIANVFAETYN